MASQPIQRGDKRPRPRSDVMAETSMVVQELTRMVTEAQSKRSSLEKRWLEDLRQFHGNYEDDVARILKQEDSRSELFINITRPKTNAWAARVADMLFPNDDKNWGVEPTPVPTLTRQARELAAEAEELETQAAQAVEANNAALDEGEAARPELGMMAEQSASQAKQLREREKQAQREIETAKRASSLMEREINDQLVESRYPAISRDVIGDMCKLGSGILKGPIVREHGPRLWLLENEEGEDGEKSEGKGEWKLAHGEDPAPKYRRVNPWHFFPDPTAECIMDAGYTFERHLPNRKSLRKMARELGFSKDAVRHLLKREGKHQGEAGDSTLSYLAELRSMEGGGDNSGDQQVMDDRFVVWEFYGQLEADQVAVLIRGMGRHDDAEQYEDDADPLTPLMVRVFFCGDTLLKIEENHILDSGEPLYSVVSFEKAENSILGGVGVPRLMRHEQSMLNAAVRMMMDNAALAVGPQVVIDKERIEPENNGWKLTARKVWQWVKSPGRGDTPIPPFATYDIPINQQFLAAIIQLALRFVDESVAMPVIAQGEQGDHVTQTAHGMTMLFNNANVVFRHVIKNWDDDLTEPTIRRAYDFNMQFSPKDEIKGDMKANARGTSVLLVREMQAEQLTSIIDRYAVHPILGVALKAYEAMRLVLQALSINPSDVLLDKEDYMAKLKEMQESSAGQESPEMIRAQSAIEVANIDANSRLQVADMNVRVQEMRLQQSMVELAKDREISIAQIEAMFQTAQLKTASDERKLAVETAVERENAREARAMGMQPTGSGGTISMGARENG